LGASPPLGLLAPGLRACGVSRFVGITHGHEAAWSQLPVASSLLRRIGEGVDVLTYLGEYTRSRMARVLTSEAAARMVRLAPGVDETLFHPGAGGSEVRERYGLMGRPVVVCVSRLVPRKGQDTLIRSWPAVVAGVPDAVLLLVGSGPYRGDLERLTASCGVAGSVRFTGSVPWPELPAHYAAGDVFAMPCRTRRRGLDVEGLGIVYLEASATGLPVIAGDSGGAPDAVLEGETGLVVPGDSIEATAAAVIELLQDPERAVKMGEQGRSWVEREWTWTRQAGRLNDLLKTDHGGNSPWSVFRASAGHRGSRPWPRRNGSESRASRWAARRPTTARWRSRTLADCFGMRSRCRGTGPVVRTCSLVRVLDVILPPC
jgi:phosphatidyl-myo-inositol dimannoside synthase